MMTNSDSDHALSSDKHPNASIQDLNLSRQYSWYPNGQIPSPTKIANMSHDPTPKSMSTTQRHTSQITSNPLAKLSYNMMQPIPMESFGDVCKNVQQPAKKASIASAVKQPKKDRRNTQFDISHTLFSVNDLNFKPKTTQMRYNYNADASPRHPDQAKEEPHRLKQHSMILNNDFHAKKFAGFGL